MSVDEAQTATTATFVTALVFNSFVFAVEIVAFTIVWPYFKSVYEPRTLVPQESKRIQPLSPSRWTWPINLFKADYHGIIKANGLDAYFFVRFLRMMIKILLPIWFISWPILMPITSVGTRVANNSGLDLFAFGNVSPDKQIRYVAHIICLYLFTGWVLFVIWKEMENFVAMRQQHLIDPQYTHSVQATTLLITQIPVSHRSKASLLELFKDIPGGVKKVWINRNTQKMPKLFDRRLDACAKLESAETALLRTAAKERLAAEKAAAKAPNPKKEDQKKTTSTSEADLEGAAATNGQERLPEVPKEKRPQHRLGWIPFVGKKVDTIDWAREEIRTCTEELEKERRAFLSEGDLKKQDAKIDQDNAETPLVDENSKDAKGYPLLNSAFVTFYTRNAARQALRALERDRHYAISGRYTDVNPEDVIWGNLGVNRTMKMICIAISYSLTAVLIIFWAIPVAFVGVISNIYTVCSTVKFLGWICTLPKPVVGIISGILPPVFLAILMMLLPIVLRRFAQLEGIPKRTGVELSLMTRFFIFQVVHSFFIMTLSSGIVPTIKGLKDDPSSAPSLLATGLPKASTFFLTYVLLQGLSGVGGGFLQIVDLAVYYVKLVLLGSTPRFVYGIKYAQRTVQWGTLFPMTTLLTLMALGYSIISPVMNGLACAMFFGLYMMYKYLFLWSYEENIATDTGGLFFPKAIQHVFVALYVQEFCLAALFFLARNERGKASSLPEGALAVALIVITIVFNVYIKYTYRSRIHDLPENSESAVVNEQSSAVPEDTGAGPAKERTVSMISSVDSPRATGYITAESSIHEDVRTSVAVASPPNKKNPPTPEEAGFTPPAAYKPQRTVWMPRDTLGLWEEEVSGCEEAGVDASVKDATMNAKGKVDVTGIPPDEED